MKQLTGAQILLLLIPICALQPLGMDIFVPTIPAMMLDLNCSEHAIQFVAISFMLASGIGQPFVGILCDKIGRRQLALLSTLVFALSALGIAFSVNIFWISFFRFIAGLGACGALITTFSVVNDVFSGNAAFRAFSLIGCALAVTTMVAPTLGVGLAHFCGGWRASFWGLFFISSLILLLHWRYLPETRPEDTQVPSLKCMARDWKFVLGQPEFRYYTFYGSIAMTQLYLYFSVGSILFIHVLGVTPFGFSLIFAFNALMYMLGNYLSSKMLNRATASQVCNWGTSATALGGFMMMVFHLSVGSAVPLIIASNSLMTFGVGMMMGPATGAALEPFKKLSGVASGVYGAIQYSIPALIGLLVTRYPINSSLSIAIPLLTLAVMGLWISKRYGRFQRNRVQKNRDNV